DGTPLTDDDGTELDRRRGRGGHHHHVEPIDDIARLVNRITLSILHGMRGTDGFCVQENRSMCLQPEYRDRTRTHLRHNDARRQRLCTGTADGDAVAGGGLALPEYPADAIPDDGAETSRTAWYVAGIVDT